MRIIVPSPHGDDSTIHAGGWVVQQARAGHEVTIVRITNDEKDSFSGDIPTTVRANRDEAEAAAAILGASFRSFEYRDCEMDPLDETELRGRLVGVFREIRPDLVMGFDPRGAYEENPDHLKCARAMDDACWSANYPHSYPEQLRGGLAPHCVARRAYFSRSRHGVNRAFDIDDVLDIKIQAMHSAPNDVRRDPAELPGAGEGSGALAAGARSPRRPG
jgi:LmbE family N-acetylglucosaminyl deacetylase